MIQSLTIKNFVLIKELKLDLHPGFSVITGETGAGKSIMLEALGMLLGNRADLKVVKQNEKKCVIEAEFHIGNLKLESQFKSFDLDYDDECIIRREISASGKSRSFVNDTPVNLNVLKELGAYLIDIHSQHSVLLLKSGEFVFQLIDKIAKTELEVSDFGNIYTVFLEKRKKLDGLLREIEVLKQNEGFWKFQFDELSQADLKQSEDEEIEAELKISENAELISSRLDEGANLLQSQNAILDCLYSLEQKLGGLSDIAESYKELSERVVSVRLELEDISTEITNLRKNTSFDQYRFDELQNRLAQLYSMMKKNNVASVNDLIELQTSLEDKLNKVSGDNSETSVLEKEIDEIKADLFKRAKSISKKRLKVIPQIESEVMDSLKDLKMENARFSIQHELQKELVNNGIDRFELLFSANKGVDLQKLSNAASGGEMSRVMLSIKALFAKHLNLPTIIFDEIDSGVSGDVAFKMASKMSEMGESMQLISISHLPQLASKAKFHYKVSKSVVDGTTITKIAELSEKERVDEIAGMLSGESITDKSIKNAKELLKSQ